MTSPLVGSMLFACVGVTIEVVLTGIVRFRKQHDKSLEGYSYIWMIPVYALAWPILVVLLPKIGTWHVVIRGLIYVIILLAVEYIAGMLLRILLGECPWEKQYKGKKWAIDSLVRLDYAPGWFVVALVFEWLFKQLS